MLQVKDLSVTYAGVGGRPGGVAVKSVSLDLARGESVAIVGESGSGKSTFAMSLFGLIPSNAEVVGSIRFDGQEILGAPDRLLRSIRGKRVGFVFQNPLLSLNPVYTIERQMTDITRLHLGLSRVEAREAALAALDAVAIENPAARLRAYPHELSGGMRQRVLIAMATSCNPALIVADEATTALDVLVQKRVLKTIVELRARIGSSMLFITHDLRLVRGIADRVIVMLAGEVVEEGPVDEVFSRPAHEYTRRLLAARAWSLTPAAPVSRKK